MLRSSSPILITQFSTLECGGTSKEIIFCKALTLSNFLKINICLPVSLSNILFVCPFISAGLTLNQTLVSEHKDVMFEMGQNGCNLATIFLTDLQGSISYDRGIKGTR